MKRTRATALWALIAGAIAAAIPALATHTNQSDPNDTAGRLDVRSVTLAHDETPRWRIATFGSWTVREIWDAGDLIVQLDTRGDEGVDYLLVLRSDGRELLGSLYRIRSDGDERIVGRLDAAKDGSRGAMVSVALHRLRIGSARTSYRWSVLTSFTGSGCARTCLDRAPDDGMVEQSLPGVTPTPTPSPSTSPSPTPSPSPSLEGSSR